ncbi:hypothetical protein CR105_04570 [Massilia eurypsychrophila]|uniref:Erythromycin esterase n=1 Tax=Massilia eurypsychrophila TaxID=1485217 RepID=A0A2G8TJZ7_9BURK|nr:erythromycin esterase family protein [Massilia eurypsychrophila]PIL46352.1 hypothetical protein CR105_04570 [Massilia eurypsychrophila]
MKNPVCLLLLLLWSQTIAAQPIPVDVANLGFDQWKNGAPSGWVGTAAGFKASRDCAADQDGRCVLRIDSTDGYTAGSFLPLAQRIGLGAAAGRRLTLSGLIRTENVAGGAAALWLRADAPYGTTGWSPFSVTIPVPRNASGIVLGVMLTGKGTAWFDQLKLSADPSADVADAVLPAVKAIERPTPSQELLSDAALRLAPADIAPASAAWRADVASRVHPIRSLYSDDFSDLQFLKPVLAAKRVVQLGESGHGVAEFNLVKVRLIQFLHQQMGYDVIAFESSLPQCYLADQAIGSAMPIEVMKRCLFPIWHSNETLPLFDYLDASRKSGKRLTLAGFDTQDSSGGAGAPALLAPMLGLSAWARAPELDSSESALHKGASNERLAPDAVMSNAGARYAFVDFSTAKPAPATSWMFAPIVMRDWGVRPVTLIPASGYDGVLYIDTVTPPDYR